MGQNRTFLTSSVAPTLLSRPSPPPRGPRPLHALGRHGRPPPTLTTGYWTLFVVHTRAHSRSRLAPITAVVTTRTSLSRATHALTRSPPEVSRPSVHCRCPPAEMASPRLWMRASSSLLPPGVGVGANHGRRTRSSRRCAASTREASSPQVGSPCPAAAEGSARRPICSSCCLAPASSAATICESCQLTVHAAAEQKELSMRAFLYYTDGEVLGVPRRPHQHCAGACGRNRYRK